MPDGRLSSTAQNKEISNNKHGHIRHSAIKYSERNMVNNSGHWAFNNIPIYKCNNNEYGLSFTSLGTHIELNRYAFNHHNIGISFINKTIYFSLRIFIEHALAHNNQPLTNVVR